MRRPDRPTDETARLEVLRALDILDTAPEEEYDAIVRLTALICEAPIAAINLIDQDRQFGKACLGLESLTCERDVSFCTHTILERHTMIVRDTLTDERFRDNPFVTGAPHIRFYAGEPLVTEEGHALGALCVVDHEPRDLSSVQRDALRALARQTSILMELRRRSKQLEQEVIERRCAEQEACAAREHAEAANRAKSDFLSRMSHELRTPLNSVIGFSRAISRNRSGNLLPTDIQYLSRVEANGRHLLGLIDDVLDIAKVEAGRMTADIATVDIGDLVRNTVHELGGRLLREQECSVRLTAIVPERLHPHQTDATRLKQMIINLVGNALKFTERGEVRVRVVADDFGNAARIDVEDTGIGIPLDRQQAIFDAFEQATPETARSYGGTGLGLAITRAFAEMLDYRIAVASTPGLGSTFSIVMAKA